MTVSCAVEGCEGPVRSRGWCGAHYTRWRKHGDPLVTLKKGPAAGTIIIGPHIERFWRKVDRTGECWLWMAKSAFSFGRSKHAMTPAQFAWRATKRHRRTQDEGLSPLARQLLAEIGA